MQTVSVDYPRDLINIFKVREKDFPMKVLKTLSIGLYREGVVSIEKAAGIAGISIWEMQDILAKQKIPLPLHYHPEDIESDIETLKKVIN